MGCKQVHRRPSSPRFYVHPRKSKMANNLTKNSDPTLYSAFNIRNLMEKSVANPNRLNGNAAGAKQENGEKKEETDEVWSYLEAQAAYAAMPPPPDPLPARQ